VAELASSALAEMPDQSFMPLRLQSSKSWYGEILSLRGASGARLAGALIYYLRVVRRSADGRVEMYGSRQADSMGLGHVAIVTRLPGRTIGLIRGSFHARKGRLSKVDTWRCAVRMWKAYRIEGARLTD
jgi:hypothetical protein